MKKILIALLIFWACEKPSETRCECTEYKTAISGPDAGETEITVYKTFGGCEPIEPYFSGNYRISQTCKTIID